MTDIKNNMIDRIANAISVSFHEEGYIEGENDPQLWEEFRRAAKMVLEDMREPTGDMLGGEVSILKPRSLGMSTMINDMLIAKKETWQSMIDAALNGSGAE